MIDWTKELTLKEAAAIAAAANRFVTMYPEHKILDVNMDVHAVHISGCKLDLEWLNRFGILDFVHDMAGIIQHVNRETGELDPVFTPRCALPRCGGCQERRAARERKTLWIKTQSVTRPCKPGL